MSTEQSIQRPPAEQTYRHELERLKAQDTGQCPPGWLLSPAMVERFILGDEGLRVSRKFVSDPGRVRRILVSLCTHRGCLLVGEPGTAKSWLSELITAAVSGQSTLTLQGGAVNRVDQLLYRWNDTILAERGPCREALVPSPLLRGMERGQLVRFEELARCPQPLQDALLSILSDRVAIVPELPGADGVIQARGGFNVIATSNSVDEGLFRMSAALKRRLDFEEIRPIARVEDEIEVVQRELASHNRRAGIEPSLDPGVIEALVTLFHEVRNGQTLDGRSTDRLAGAALSTAEAVSVAHATCLHACYFGDGQMTPETLMHHLVGSALKDQPDDRRRLRHYFDTEVATRKGKVWGALYRYRDLLS
ncbi:ATP-binding protein [Marinobacter xestospongiae]|uniref:ATP-binding protein n=1 Tax=Marinobacter xestospongiae TaxID=994319 RepID=UPI0020041E8A|nr:AAA family ATPase [Marinobacter xestospongiae]MCK7566582.1 AAA family ATPase [Marinobacter xestospongiae]